jgi:pimeloyl-ACP methyl ester carboxylesterase
VPLGGPPPPASVVLSDGRSLAYDDAGDPDGSPVVFFHGTPDSRRARHPDDQLAAAAGVRLVAVDRPGIGGSDHDPDRTHGSFADDVVALLDQLGIEQVAAFGWSAGAVPALALAAQHPDRVRRVLVVAGLVPFAAYDDPAVLAAAGLGRRSFVATARELTPAEVGRELAPMFIPYPVDPDGARAQVESGWGAVEAAEAAAVPGAPDAMAFGLLDATFSPSGTEGLARDLALQVQSPDVDLGSVSVPVELVYGSEDETTPPEMGRWFADHVPGATCRVIDGAGHLVALAQWQELLTSLR